MIRHIAVVRLGLVALLSLSLGMVGCASTGSQQTEATTTDGDPQQLAQEQFIAGNDALDAGDWQQAIDHYERAVDADPDRWDAHLNRAIALTNSGQPQDGVDAFLAALEIDGVDKSAVYFNLGNHYQDRSMYEPAIDAYRASMGYGDGLDYETLLNISACFAFLNAFDEARQTAERAIEMRPDDPQARVTLGVVRYSEDQPDQALELYDQLLADHPDFAPAHYNRAFVLLRIGELQDARRSFENYLDRAPDGPYTQQAENHIRTIDNRLDR